MPFRFLPILLLLLAPATALAEGFPLDYLTLKGQVRGQDGQGVADVRVWVNGEDYETRSDASGNYELLIPLHEYGDFKSSTKIRVKAQGDKVYLTASRQALVALDIKRESRDGKEHCEVRGNVRNVVLEVGDAIAAGQPKATVSGVPFLYPEKAARRLTMRAKHVVIMGDRKAPPPDQAEGGKQSSVPATAGAAGAAGATASAKSATEAAAPKPAAKPSAREGDSHVRRVGDDAGVGAAAEPSRTGPDVEKMPGPGVKQTDASAIRRVPASPARGAAEVGALTLADVEPIDDCECLIRGTVELHPDHLLTDRLRVFVSLARAPSVRDTLELFMGSPRAFELPALRCGTWALHVEAVSKRDFSVVSTDGSRAIECPRGGLHQLRIVLAPQ